LAIKYLDAKRIRGSSVNSSAFFDGTNDYVTAPATILSGIGTGIFSMAMWIKSDTNSRALIGYSSGNYWEIHRNGSAKIEYSSNTNRYGNTVVSNNTWYHLVIQRNGSDIISMWVDGVAQTMSDATADTVSFSGDVTIGKRGSFWSGNIQDLVITSDLLTLSEILDLAGGKTVAQVNPDNQTVYYPFTTDFTDSSGNSRNGTTTGSVITATNGRGDDKATLITTYADSLGSAVDATNNGATADSATAINGKASLTFDDSNDWISLGTGLNSSIDGNAFSISLWAYVSATNINDKTIIGKQIAGYSSPYHVFNFRAYNGNWALTTNDGSSYAGDATTAISHTGWTHIVATFDGTSSFKVYADNVEVCSYSNSNTNWSNSYWSLGNGEGTTRWWDSEIQDVAFWSRVLTSGERATLLNSYAHGTATSSGNTGKVATDISTTGLLAYYTLNDTTTGVTNSATDYSDLPENTVGRQNLPIPSIFWLSRWYRIYW